MGAHHKRLNIKPSDGRIEYEINMEKHHSVAFGGGDFSRGFALSSNTEVEAEESYTYDSYTAEYDITEGSVSISTDGTYRVYGESSENTISVSGSKDVILVLDGVNISSASTSPIYLNNTGTTTIVLKGTNTFENTVTDKSSTGSPAIDKSTSGYLVIAAYTNADSAGSLTAVGGAWCAGIGSGSYNDCKNITINSGTITATGGYSGAGIGSGYLSNASYITINGGTITATGGDSSSGIGGGSGTGTSNSGNGSNITINGGTVAAYGAHGSPGIGGSTKGSDITINGGNVTAVGGTKGSLSTAGIGSGYVCSGSNIIISGGTVTATGYGTGDGIGGDTASSTESSNIQIYNASVKTSSIGTTPTDANGNEVYLYTVSDTTEGDAIIVDGTTVISSVSHHTSTDTNQYLYLTADAEYLRAGDSFYVLSNTDGTTSVSSISTIDSLAQFMDFYSKYINTEFFDGVSFAFGNADEYITAAVTTGTTVCDLTLTKDLTDIEIPNADILALFRDLVNLGYQDLNGTLTADIVMNEGTWETDGDTWTEWTPIGYYNIVNDYFEYTGTFDGQNHTISGLYCNNNSAGLFGYCFGSTVKNLGIVNSYIVGNVYSGAFCARAAGSAVFDNCYNASTVTAENANIIYVGGICGYLGTAYLTDCYNTADITVDGGSSSVYVGGIYGRSENQYGNTASGCYNTGNITAESSMGAFAGGIYGYLSYVYAADETGIYNTGNITAISTGNAAYAGGIGAYMSYTISSSDDTAKYTNCYNKGAIRAEAATNAYAGGLGGQFYGVSPTYCYNTNTVTAVGGSEAYAGGIGAVYNATTYADTVSCYNTGAVTADAPTTAYAGGLFGSNSSSGDISITNSYSSGAITATADTSYAGGIAGYNTSCEITDCYESTGTGVGYDAQSATDIISLTDTQFISGEAAFMLNGSITAGTPWYQTIGSDAAPLLDSTHNAVYIYYTTVYKSGTYNTSIGFNNVGTTTGYAYYIDSAEDLCNLSRYVNAGNSYVAAYMSGDVDMSGVTDFVPIGYDTEFDSTADSYTPKFTGEFYGVDWTISNLTITDNGYATAGLFGSVGDGAFIECVHLDNFNFEKTDSDIDGRYGAICGLVTEGGTVVGCRVMNSSVTASGKVAGIIAGSNYGGTVESCYSVGDTVTATRSGYIVGDNRNDTSTLVGEVINCCTDSGSLTSSYTGTVTGGATGLSSDDFRSGKAAWLLNGEDSDGYWQQTLGSNACDYPRGYDWQLSPVYYDKTNGYHNKLYNINAEVATFTSDTIPTDITIVTDGASMAELSEGTPVLTVIMAIDDWEADTVDFLGSTIEVTSYSLTIDGIDEVFTPTKADIFGDNYYIAQIVGDGIDTDTEYTVTLTIEYLLDDTPITYVTTETVTI